MRDKHPNGTELNAAIEYYEGMDVKLLKRDGKWVVVAINEAGYNGTEVDLTKLLAFCAKEGLE